MKAIVALAMFCLFTRANAQAAGQVVMVDGQATKYCQDCVNFFSDIQQLVKSKNTTAQIEQLFDQMICSQMESLEDMCKDLVKQYVPQFLQYLSSMEDPKQVCGFLGMCTQEMMSLIKLKPKMLRGEECDLCKTAVTELRSLVRDQATEGEIKDFIETNVCPLFGSLTIECKKQVDAYAALVFQVLANELDPTVVCEMLGLCSQNKMVSLSRVGLTSSVTKVEVIKPAKVKVATPKKLNDEGCVLCEFVLKEIDSILANNRTQAAIEEALDKVCAALPATITKKCTAFVNQYGPLIINLLLQEVSPNVVCQTIGLCPNAMKETDTPDCVLCEFVMSEVDKILGNNRSQASVEAALEKVCGLMPDTISQECEQFVEAYGPAVINLLIQELQPKAVCRTLRLCTSSKHVRVAIPEHKKVSASTGCLICEFIMQELDTLLGDNRTEQQVKTALDQVCNILPSTVRSTCVDFINTYSPAIVQLLVQELDPQLVCTRLGVCNNMVLGRRLQPSKTVLKTGNSEECDLCVTIFSYLDELLKENSTVQEVIALLDSVCNYLPNQLKSQCEQFVNEYAALVINLISSDLSPRQICEELGVCNATRKDLEMKNNRIYFKPSNLVGTNKCTYGPSYWCLSKENAIECGTVEHCKNHVWKN